MVAKKVQELLNTVDPEKLVHDLPKIMEILTDISSESMLTADLLSQVPFIAAKAAECATNCEELKNIVSDYLIPLVVRNLSYKDDSVVDKAARSALIQLIKQGFINEQQVEIRVCPSILALSKIEANIDGSVELMCKLAPLLGRDVTERVFMKRFTELCADDQFLVRKVCSSHFGEFCAVVGKDSFDKVLLPCYVKLCADEIWSVRKSSAEAMMFVSCASPQATRKTVLAPILTKLLEDECRWVRLSAFHTLGPFISTFATPRVTSTTYNFGGELVLVNHNGIEFLKELFNRDWREGGGGSYCLPNFFAPVDPAVAEELLGIMGEKDEPPAGEKGAADAEIDVGGAPPVVEMETDEDIQAMVETMKCAVLGYGSTANGNAEQSPEGGDVARDENRNVPEIRMDGGAEEVNRQCGGGAEEDLHLFNSYNYWYIKPPELALPLDPGLPDGGRRSDGITSNLEDLFSKINLSQSLNSSLDITPILNGEGGDQAEDEPNNDEEDDEEPTTAEEEDEEPPFTQDIVPQPLVDFFIAMTEPTLALNLDHELAYDCAYSLPAVALTLGSPNWCLLKKTVDALAENMQYKVRRIVASSLHELAAIVGPDIAGRDLAPLFDGFIKDLDEVRIGVLRHLADFLGLVEAGKRAAYLPRLEEFMRTDSESNWRFREELAQQLAQTVERELFGPQEAAKHIGGIAQNLLSDKVAAVRQAAIRLLIELIRRAGEEEGLVAHLLIKLAERYAHSAVWKRRQSFALLCAELLASRAIPEEQFASEAMPHLLDLSWDPVANVRLVVARILTAHVLTNDYFVDPANHHLDGLDSVVKRLQGDKDKDVRDSAGWVEQQQQQQAGGGGGHVGVASIPVH